MVRIVQHCVVFCVSLEIKEELVRRTGAYHHMVVFVVVQTPIPAVVLSYRLSRSLRGWHPGHHELAGSAADLSLSQEDQRQQQKQQQQQQPDSEYGAIAKFAGMTTSRRYHRGNRERGF